MIEIKIPVLVETALLVPNPWNPNHVAKPEMELLELSVKKSGFCFPLVVIRWEGGRYMIVDGFHRHLVAKKFRMPQVPVVILDEPMEELMAVTIRFNMAKGTHQVDRVAKMVGDLVLAGRTNQEIAKDLGMDADEVLRLKQHAGMPGLFKDRGFSKAWDPGAGEDL